MNEDREHTEKVIDKLYKTQKSKLKAKPRTYRKQARKDYLLVAKSKKVSKKKRIKALKKQLGYLKRNLSYIDELIELGASLTLLKKSNYKLLLVVQELYRQQLWMLENKAKRIDNRIVSLTQPYVRPIVRGKARQGTEFGAKNEGLESVVPVWVVPQRTSVLPKRNKHKLMKKLEMVSKESLVKGKEDLDSI